MATFTYRAMTATGETQTGVMDAPDRRVVMQRLRSKELRPVEITAKGGAAAAAAVSQAKSSLIPEAAPDKNTAIVNNLDPEAFKGEKIALSFLKKLYQLNSGGMPLGDSIRLLSVRVTDPKQASLATRLWKDISEGRTFANALRNYPKTFSTATVSLIEAGETTGNLSPVLKNVTDHLEERAQLRKQISSGLAYPIFICTLAFGVMLLFLYFLLPRINDMMRSMGGEMNFLTRMLIGASQFAAKWGWAVLILVVIGAVMLFRWRKTPEGRSATDAWLLKIPLFKGIFLNIDICHISNLCATLLESGLNTTETLRMTERTVENTVVQSRFNAARTLINDGASFSNAFRRYGVLPDLDLDMLSVGENTGNIAKSFREIYKVHSEQLAQQFHFMTIAITSGALGTAFMLVAILAISIVLSVLGMSKSLLGHK
ncbi:MAG TPA: type II secretion system F family protein [Opitutales bacterium]|nr:type II secretion system F family protein [Opitutales bacterium]